MLSSYLTHGFVAVDESTGKDVEVYRVMDTEDDWWGQVNWYVQGWGKPIVGAEDGEEHHEEDDGEGEHEDEDGEEGDVGEGEEDDEHGDEDGEEDGHDENGEDGEVTDGGGEDEEGSHEEE